MKNKPVLLGITGAFGSGKSTASHYFETHGMTKISLSMFLEAELKKNGELPITRKALQDLGNEWRQTYGAGILAQKALAYIKEQSLTHVVIDGVRNLGEIEVLRNDPSFLLLGIVCDRDKRFERLKKAPRRETLNWELFTKLDYRDLGIGEADTGLQTGLCIAMADIFIDNNEAVAVFTQKLEKLFQ